MNGWILKIARGAAPNVEEAWFAGRKSGQHFLGNFDLASLQRCYAFTKKAANAHVFTRASDAFQVLTILKNVGIPSTVQVLSDNLVDGQPQCTEAGFVVEVDGRDPAVPTRYFRAIAADGEWLIEQDRIQAQVLDFMSAMDIACRLERAGHGLASLKQVEIRASSTC